jgi:benzil reductase ((S)-benzoin forming)
MSAVVITGVSRGLGAALFDACNARNDRIMAVGRHFTDQQRAVRDARPVEVALHATDLADPRWLPDAETLRIFMRDDSDVVLIHNAAVVEPIGAVGSLQEEAAAAAVSVNLTAPMLITNAFLRAVPRDAERVRILFISSGAAHQPIEGWSIYCATKAAGEMFFEVVALQVKDDERISIATIEPGTMNTGMQAEIRRAAEFPLQQQFRDAHQEGKLADPMQVAERIIKEHLS